MRLTIASTVLALALTAIAIAQQPPSVLRGSWTATVGTARTFRGSWSATVESATPNAARGGWVLLDDGNRIMLEGTWSAEKSTRGWEGTWAARVGKSSGGRASQGRALAGSWRANVKDSKILTLKDLLQHALVDQVTGTWRSGGLAGGWRLAS
jgi:hypothetical protein